MTSATAIEGAGTRLTLLVPEPVAERVTAYVAAGRVALVQAPIGGDELMFVALCGDKGSPGVTTTALALASAWAGHAVVVEADPAGGDLAIRLHPEGSALPETPTVLSVATAARGDSRAGSGRAPTPTP